jgi:hypothetical protein
MAHAHTRTLLAKLGFADKDRQNSRHDAACNYIALSEGALARTIEAAAGPSYRATNSRGTLEKLVQKGEGQYATTIGFIDVAASFDYVRRLVVWAEPGPNSIRVPAEVSGSASCIIEVKIGRVSSGDLIRQLKLYEEYHHLHCDPPRFVDPDVWRHYDPNDRERRDRVGQCAEQDTLRRLKHLKIAVLDYDVDAEYVSALRSEGIEVVRLGVGFERYIATQKASTTPVELAQV